MHHFAIKLLPVEEAKYGWPEIRFLIDGVDIIDEALMAATSCDVEMLLDPDSPLLPQDQPVVARIATEFCDVECCGALDVRVSVDGDQVVWSQWHNSVWDIELGEYRFDLAAYLAEFARADQERGGERPGRTVARLVRAALLADPGIFANWNSTVDHVCCRFDREEVELRFTYDRSGYPDAAKVPFWKSQLSIPVTAEPPAAQAERLLTRLRTVDPRPAC